MKLSKLHEWCKEHKIILNDEKKEIGLKEITFHGHKITSDGVKVDDKKVNAIREMQTPTDFTGVKRLCGMAQYMAAFLPDLANEMEQIRELTRFSLELVKRTRASISKGLRKLRS